jgi:hypothetical protein
LKSSVSHRIFRIPFSRSSLIFVLLLADSLFSSGNDRSRRPRMDLVFFARWRRVEMGHYDLAHCLRPDTCRLRCALFAFVFRFIFVIAHVESPFAILRPGAVLFKSDQQEFI